MPTGSKHIAHEDSALQIKIKEYLTSMRQGLDQAMKDSKGMQHECGNEHDSIQSMSDIFGYFHGNNGEFLCDLNKKDNYEGVPLTLSGRKEKRKMFPLLINPQGLASWGEQSPFQAMIHLIGIDSAVAVHNHIGKDSMYNHGGEDTISNHKGKTEGFIVIEGELLVVSTDTKYTVEQAVILQPGEYFIVPRGKNHTVKALSEVALIAEFKPGQYIKEGDEGADKKANPIWPDSRRANQCPSNEFAFLKTLTELAKKIRSGETVDGYNLYKHYCLNALGISSSDDCLEAFLSTLQQNSTLAKFDHTIAHTGKKGAENTAPVPIPQPVAARIETPAKTEEVMLAGSPPEGTILPSTTSLTRDIEPEFQSRSSLRLPQNHSNTPGSKALKVTAFGSPASPSLSYRTLFCAPNQKKDKTPTPSNFTRPVSE